MKRYYVGAMHIGQAIADGLDAGGTRATIEEAVADASAKIRRGESRCLVIVQIIAVVRKDEVPVSVEYIGGDND
jgi:hypothetical protein